MREKTFKKQGFWAMSILLAFFMFGVVNSRAATLYGVSVSNQLVRFDSATPGTVTMVGAISGLQSGENVLAIDFRPANGQLYALGSTSRLYTLNTVNAMATAIGSAGAFTIAGTDFGFDFNPTVDRIRLVSNTGQNIRLHPDTGALAATDTALNPGTPSVSAAAYINNFSGATTTTLYDIDTATDTLFTQNPPNNGTLVSVGALGVDATGVNGFDIASIGGTAFAALNVGGTSRLYTINLTTGAATQVGAIGAGLSLRGLSVATTSAANMTSSLDFDGDRRADYTNFNLSNANWAINRSSNNSIATFPYGFASDLVVPGDYDGDGLADVAVWRPSNGTWYVTRSSNGTFFAVNFGLGTDEPVQRDYDGDGKTDVAVVRRTGGSLIWYILNSSNNSFRAEQFGLSSDSVATGDFDGDGKFDLGVKRGGANAIFYMNQSTAGFRAVQFGLGEDINVTGDYDGDGKTDVAVIREGTNWTWYILRSSDNSFVAAPFGGKAQLSVQADYNGDGKTDIATFVPSNSTYYILQTPNFAFTQRTFGTSNDFPIANYNTY